MRKAPERGRWAFRPPLSPVVADSTHCGHILGDFHTGRHPWSLHRLQTESATREAMRERRLEGLFEGLPHTTGSTGIR